MIIGIIASNTILDTLFNTLSIRQDHYFCEFVGVADLSSYNDTLALLHSKLSLPHKGLIFDSGIPLPDDSLLTDTLSNELLSIASHCLISESLHLSSSDLLDTKLKEALDYVITLAVEKGHFTKYMAYNELTKALVIWSITYIEGLDFSDKEPPKCLFYGAVNKESFYFLMLLAHVGVDVLYFNPTGNLTLVSLDTNHLCQQIVLGPPLGAQQVLMEHVSQGVVIEKVTTYARQATSELEQTLYHDTGIYRPWQFSNGTTCPVIMDSVIEDTLTYWNEPARLRPGFKTSDRTVYTPIFLSKISGVYKNHQSYFELVEKLKSADECLFYETTRLTSSGYKQSKTIKYHNLPGQSIPQDMAYYNPQDLSSLSLCLTPDKRIDRNQIKEQVLYQKLLTLRSETQEFILAKLETLWSPSYAPFFEFPITDTERVRLMATIFTAEDRLLGLIERYDFTAHVPKVILYLSGRETFHTDDAMLLGLLHLMSFDLIIMSPNGANNIELMISDKFINFIKLETFVDNLSFKPPTKKKSFLSKLFK